MKAQIIITVDIECGESCVLFKKANSRTALEQFVEDLKLEHREYSVPTEGGKQTVRVLYKGVEIHFGDKELIQSKQSPAIPAGTAEDLVDTLQSFNKAVSNCSMAVPPLENLKETSVYDFLKICSLNGIRFYNKETACKQSSVNEVF